MGKPDFRFDYNIPLKVDHSWAVCTFFFYQGPPEYRTWLNFTNLIDFSFHPSPSMEGAYLYLWAPLIFPLYITDLYFDSSSRW